MKRRMILVFLSLAVAFGSLADEVAGQQELLDSFLSTGTDGKVALLRRLHADPRLEATAVYLAGLDFSVDHAQEALDDPRVNEIGRLSIESLATLPVSGAVPSVWRFFKAQTCDNMRIHSLRVIRKSSDEVPDHIAVALADFLSRQNHMSRAGYRTNAELLSTTVAALADIKHASAFEVLFEVATHPNHSGTLRRSASAGLAGLDVDVDRELLGLLDSAAIEGHGSVLAFAGETQLVSRDTAEKIARRCLRYSMESRYRDLSDAAEAKQLRHRAAARLSELDGFSPPVLAVEYLDVVYSEYRRSETSLAYLVEAIGFVGQTGDATAAVRLNELLDTLNTMVEFDEPVADQLVIATIRQIDRLGDPVAADTLLQTQLLDYPRNVRRMAQEVETRLRRG